MWGSDKTWSEGLYSLLFEVRGKNQYLQYQHLTHRALWDRRRVFQGKQMARSNGPATKIGEPGCKAPEPLK